MVRRKKDQNGAAGEPDPSAGLTEELHSVGGAGAVNAGKGSSANGSSKSRKGLFIGLGVVIVLILAYIGGALALGDRVPGKTSVAGVDISNMTSDEAVSVLKKELADATTKPIKVSFKDQATTLDPKKAGLTFDPEATVDAVTGFTLNPRILFGHLFGLGDVKPVADVDDSELASTLEDLSAQIKIEPVEGAIAFADGKAKVTEPKDGAELDIKDAKKLVAKQWITGERPLVLPAKSISPKIDQPQIDDAMSNQVEPMLSGPVTLKVNDKEAKIEPKVMAAAASMKVDGDSLHLVLDGEKLADQVTKEVPSIGKRAHDAKIVLKDGKPKVIPAVTGTGMDADDVAKAVTKAATSPKDRTASISLKKTDADFTTEDAKKLGVKEVIGEYKTPYPYNPTRTKNLKAGTAHINGTLVMPGDKFSLLDALKPISTSNGYYSSGVVENGFESEAVGGGLSQVSTTTFNAAFESGMVDVTHQPHSRWFDRYPAGREATLWDPSVDMVFENNTGHGVLIQAYVTSSDVVVKMWGTDVFDVSIKSSEHYNAVSPRTVYNTAAGCMAESGGKQGFTINVTRTVTKKSDGSKVSQKTYTHTYTPWNRVVCGSPPAPKSSDSGDKSSKDKSSKSDSDKSSDNKSSDGKKD